MTIAINLLISAMTLLTMIQQNPNLPQSFKDSAVGIANQAIVVAQDEIAKANQTATNPVVINTVTPVQTVQQPTFGGIIVPMETPIDKSAIIAELLKVTKDADTPYFGNYILKVSVLNANGEYVNKAEVSMSAPEDYFQTVGQNKESRFTEARQNNDDKNWYVTFPYIPMTQGAKDITFTSGNLSKTVTINVQ